MSPSLPPRFNSGLSGKICRELAGWDQVPLFCVQEMYVEGSLPSCIRV